MTWGTQATVLAGPLKTSGTTHGRTYASTVVVGTIVIIEWVTDNFGTTSGDTTEHQTVTDTQSNTYTKLFERTFTAGVAADGVTRSAWITQITTQVTTADTATLTIANAVTAKVVRGLGRTVTGGNTWQNDGVTHATGSDTAPTVTSATLSSIERLWMGLVGWEGISTNFSTEDADYTDGGSGGTTGDADITNVAAHVGSRVATITADTYAVVLGATRDWGVSILAVAEVTSDITASDTGTLSESLSVLDAFSGNDTGFLLETQVELDDLGADADGTLSDSEVEIHDTYGVTESGSLAESVAVLDTYSVADAFTVSEAIDALLESLSASDSVTLSEATVVPVDAVVGADTFTGTDTAATVDVQIQTGRYALGSASLSPRMAGAATVAPRLAGTGTLN